MTYAHPTTVALSLRDIRSDFLDMALDASGEYMDFNTRMDRQYLLDVATRRVAIEWAKAQKAYPILRNIATPTTKISARLKTTAGYACYGAHSVEFSASLMWEHTEHFIKDTIPHEVAHLVTHRVYPDVKGHHNAEWYAIMLNVYGIKATRCHSLINTEWEARKARAI